MNTDQLVLQFMSLADALSRRYRAPGCEAEDLQQVARLGLVKAARRYHEAGNYGFVAFAVPTINGELKRHLRDHSWAVRPPRAIQEATLKIKHLRPELTQRLGREPSTSDLSTASGLSEKETTLALLAEMAMVAQQLEHNDSSTSSKPRVHDVVLGVDDPAYERIEQEMIVEAALRDASMEDRRLLYLRFVLELSQGQIAQEIGVSQMQISRHLRQLLGRLGRRLTEPAIM
ncbi:sigma-70 family RNA polymerase sigma factor [Paeniglutamicibacter terrestris]|uniref:Sigma-70 family RNA polymerase sigma factor n=1 Tax=Paeniglutamicibacter terrestris TaxID=2723403 RepID=A0ABX1G807_9MICC|nr:sigma-70 family RNA polymerase sigma factor [Paeniglutamicibacter terrestris]NKG21780.1 sigma-70 family RNA polymerase sigma factor [Paeniglutamicibacter terrestris]